MQDIQKNKEIKHTEIKLFNYSTNRNKNRFLFLQKDKVCLSLK